MKRLSSRLVKAFGVMVGLLALAVLIGPTVKPAHAGGPSDRVLTADEMVRVFGDVPWLTPFCRGQFPCDQKLKYSSPQWGCVWCNGTGVFSICCNSTGGDKCRYTAAAPDCDGLDRYVGNFTGLPDPNCGVVSNCSSSPQQTDGKCSYSDVDQSSTGCP